MIKNTSKMLVLQSLFCSLKSIAAAALQHDARLLTYHIMVERCLQSSKTNKTGCFYALVLALRCWGIPFRLLGQFVKVIQQGWSAVCRSKLGTEAGHRDSLWPLVLPLSCSDCQPAGPCMPAGEGSCLCCKGGLNASAQRTAKSSPQGAAGAAAAACIKHSSCCQG